MKTRQAQAKIKKALGTKAWYDFLKFMEGQTVGLNKDGTTDWYDCDVEKFLRLKGGKEVVASWD